MVGYIIKNKADVTTEMWDACLGNPDNAFYSKDGEKVILKFESESVPSVFAGETVLSRSEMFTETGNGEWYDE
tara:strand:- start:8553 stop:8771 length:219 start_codon:yes stop_codon:yes gene_type:complete